MRHSSVRMFVHLPPLSCLILLSLTVLGDHPLGGTSPADTSTSHSVFWGSAVGLCERPWQKVYEHSPTGDRRHGSLIDLQVAVTRGDAIRVVIHHMTSGDEILVAFSVEADNAVRYGDHVCVEALSCLNHFNILFTAHSSGDSLWHVLPCTTGHMHVLGVTLGTRRVVSDENFRVSASWFVRSWAPGAVTGCGGGAGDDDEGETCSVGQVLPSLWPVYSHYMLGNAVARKNISVLLAAVRRGQDVRAVMRDRGYSFPVHSVRWSVADSWVSGQSVAHVGQQHFSTHVAMRTDSPYLWFSSWSTTGKRHNSRWALYGHVSMGANQDEVSLDWLTDVCWRQVYSHGNKGEVLEGSLEELVASVRSGHRVRVVMGNTAMEADVLRVRGGHVGAQLLTQLSPLSEEKKNHHLLHDHVRWRWQVVHTTGTVSQHIVLAGNLTLLEENLSTAAISWFVDVRPWRRLLRTKPGAPTSGHVTDVASAVLRGASMRLRFHHAADNGDIFAAAVNINMNAIESVDPVTSAQVIRYLSDEEFGDHEVRLQGRLTWWMTIVDTTGVMSLSAWTAAHDAKYFDIKLTPEIEWFVSY